MLDEHSSWLLGHTCENRWHKIKVILVPAPGKQLPRLSLTTCKNTAQGHRLVASGQAGRQRMEAEGAQKLEGTVLVGFASFPAQKQGYKISASVP